MFFMCYLLRNLLETIILVIFELTVRQIYDNQWSTKETEQ